MCGCGVCGCYEIIGVRRLVGEGLWSELCCCGLHTSTKHEGAADPSKLTPNPNRAPLRAARQTDPSTCLASVCSWEWPRCIIPPATPSEASHCNGPPCSQLYTLHRIPLRLGQGFTLCRTARPKAKGGSGIRCNAYNWRDGSTIAALFSPTPRLLRRREVGNVDAA